MTVSVCKRDFHNVLSDKKQPGKTWACQLYPIKWLNKNDIIGFYILFPTDLLLKFAVLSNRRKKIFLFHPPPPSSWFYKHSGEVGIQPGLCFDLDNAFNSVSSAGAAGQIRFIGIPVQSLIFSLWS